MQLKKILIGGFLSTTSLSVLALIGIKQAEINNFKPFVVITVVITVVTLILGAMAYYQKQLQHR